MSENSARRKRTRSSNQPDPHPPNQPAGRDPRGALLVAPVGGDRRCDWTPHAIRNTPCNPPKNDGGAARIIAKEGAGTLRLTANGMTSSGSSLIINRGTVLTTSATALGTGTSVTVNNNALWTASTAAQQITSLNGTGRVTVATGSQPLTIGNGNASSDFSGLLNTTGGIVKVGTGLLNLSGPNTGGGAFVINGGMVRANDIITSLGSGPVTMNGPNVFPGVRKNNTEIF